MGPLEDAVLVPEIQVAADGGLGRADGFGEVGQTDEAAMADEVEHALPSFFHKHRKFLKDILTVYGLFQ